MPRTPSTIVGASFDFGPSEPTSRSAASRSRWRRAIASRCGLPCSSSPSSRILTVPRSVPVALASSTPRMLPRCCPLLSQPPRPDQVQPAQVRFGQRGRVGRRLPEEVGRLPRVAGLAAPAPAGQVARRLYVVVAVEQYSGTGQRAAHLGEERGCALTRLRPQLLQRKPQLPPEG